MELIAKLIFIMVMFGINYFAFTFIMTIKKDADQKAAVMALAGTNILATTTILYAIHPHMAHEPALLAAGFIGGVVIFAMSSMPFTK